MGARADGDESAVEPCKQGDLGCYLARDSGARDASTAYAEVVRRGQPRYWGAALELVVALGGGTAWYWIDRERQVADWDYPSWKDRFTLESWRFDNNPFGINFIWHALSGAGFHEVSRENDLSLLASVGFGFATSMAWEYLLEFREKVSMLSEQLSGRRVSRPQCGSLVVRVSQSAARGHVWPPGLAGRRAGRRARLSRRHLAPLRFLLRAGIGALGRRPGSQ